MVGNCGFVPRVLAANLDAYQQFQIKHLGRTKGVRNLETEVLMQKIKLTTELRTPFPKQPSLRYRFGQGDGHRGGHASG